jgi:hypothetical protein
MFLNFVLKKSLFQKQNCCFYLILRESILFIVVLIKYFRLTVSDYFCWEGGDAILSMLQTDGQPQEGTQCYVGLTTPSMGSSSWTLKGGTKS